MGINLNGIIKFIANIQVLPQPMFIVLGHTNWAVKAKEQRLICDLMQPGDILLRRQGHTMSSLLIPGYYSHVGLVRDKDTLVHAADEGVTYIDSLDYLQADALCLLHIDAAHLREQAVRRADEAVGKPYDYSFDSRSKHAMYCTELIMHCYAGIVPSKQQRKHRQPPDTLLTMPLSTIKHDSRLYKQVREK